MAATNPSRLKPPPPGRAAPNGPRVFISHSSKNQPLAAAVLAELEGNGIRCWMAPRDIRPGEPNYGKAIIEGLTACQAMVLLLTEPSNRSQHVMKEAERAVNKNIPILVVRFQPIKVSKELEYYVSSAQFLDATAPPHQQHLRPLRHRVRDMLVIEDARSVAVKISVDGRQHRRARRSSSIVWLAGLAFVIATSLVLWMRVGTPLRSLRDRLPSQGVTVPVSNPPAAQNVIAVAEGGAAGPRDDRPRHVDLSDAAVGESELLASVDAKARFARSLRSFVETRLANFHCEALVVTKNGPLAPAEVSDSDVELIASCRIQPNIPRYTALAEELIALLDKTALHSGTIKSDGLRTSEWYGRDARPYLKEIREKWFGFGYGSLGSVFAGGTRALYGSHYEASSPVFLIHDETVSGDRMAGIGHAASGDWLGRLRGDSGILLILASAQPSLRHTEWRWFQLSAADWKILSTGTPQFVKCVFELVDAAGELVDRGDYRLEYGARRSTTSLDNVAIDKGSLMVFAPFYVNDYLEHYIPEIILKKTVVVLKDDMSRVKDFTVSLEEVRGVDKE